MSHHPPTMHFGPASTVILSLFVLIAACGGNESESGTPSTATVEESAPTLDPSLPFQESLELGPIDAALAAEGEEIFTVRCTTCHKMGERYVGPALDDVMDRRSPEWVMNMILAPDKMVVSDPDARALFAEYSVPMTNQNLTEQEARALVEYLRTTTGS